MDSLRRAQIQRSLRTLAKSYRATMELMEQTMALLCEELALDPSSYEPPPFSSKPAVRQAFLIDPAFLTVTFRGKVCFLGKSLSFKFLSRLAERPNTYVTYEDLLADAWDGVVRSDSAERTKRRGTRGPTHHDRGRAGRPRRLRRHPRLRCQSVGSISGRR